MYLNANNLPPLGFHQRCCRLSQIFIFVSQLMCEFSVIASYDLLRHQMVCVPPMWISIFSYINIMREYMYNVYNIWFFFINSMSSNLYNSCAIKLFINRWQRIQSHSLESCNIERNVSRLYITIWYLSKL
jgi:hypothetical protein